MICSFFCGLHGISKVSEDEKMEKIVSTIIFVSQRLNWIILTSKQRE